MSDIKEGTTDAEIVKAIIAMTNQMGIRTIAEVVESQESADYLFENECYYHQGWVYGKAEPLENLFSMAIPHQLPVPPGQQQGASLIH